MTITITELKIKYPRATDAELKELAQLDIKEAKYLDIYEDYKEKHQCEFFRPWKWQARALELIQKNKIVVIPAPNDIGKTTLIILILISWVKGYEPWTKSTVEKPNYIQVGKYWYNPSSLGKQPPVRIRLTGEDWTHHIGQTLVHEIKKWFCWDYNNKGEKVYEFTPKNNNQSILYLLTFPNDSTVELMTHSQDDELFESWKGDGWLPDEPPKKSVFEGMSRGMFRSGGKMAMFMTPLSEAWILNTLIEPENPRFDVGILDGLTFLDNEALVEYDKTLLRNNEVMEGDIDKYFSMIMDYENKSKADHIKGINEYLRKIIDKQNFVSVVSDLRALKFVNDTSEDKRDCRFRGKFQSLVGRIYKEYKDFYFPNGHLLKQFKIETDWPVIVQIDFHSALPPFIGYYAFDKMNRLYVINESFERMSAFEVGHEIIRQKKKNGWRLDNVYIDPLSKGDSATLKNRFGDIEDSFSIIKKILNQADILLDVGSKDKRSGIDNVKYRLAPSDGMSTIFVLDNCSVHRAEFKQWSYDKNGNWIDEDDHAMETLGRTTLTGVKYSDPDEHKKYKFVPDKGII